MLQKRWWAPETDPLTSVAVQADLEARSGRRRGAPPRGRLEVGVGADGELAIGAGGKVAPAPGAVQRAAPQERLDRPDPGVPGAERRHRPRRLLGEHGDDARHVAGGHRLGVGGDDLPGAGVTELTQGGGLAAPADPLLDRGAGPLQGAVDGGHRGLERLPHLGGGEAEHLAQDEDGALAGRQLLHRGDEGELQRLALLGALVRPRRLPRPGLAVVVADLRRAAHGHVDLRVADPDADLVGVGIDRRGRVDDGREHQHAGGLLGLVADPVGALRARAGSRRRPRARAAPRPPACAGSACRSGPAATPPRRTRSGRGRPPARAAARRR